MKFMNKELSDIIVTLPYADGTQVDCGVVASFAVGTNTYFALLPLNEAGNPDFTQSFMLYRVDEDADHNPVVMYIEDDAEFTAVSNYFSETYLK